MSCRPSFHIRSKHLISRGCYYCSLHIEHGASGHQAHSKFRHGSDLHLIMSGCAEYIHQYMGRRHGPCSSQRWGTVVFLVLPTHIPLYAKGMLNGLVLCSSRKGDSSKQAIGVHVLHAQVTPEHFVLGRTRSLSGTHHMKKPQSHDRPAFIMTPCSCSFIALL